MNNQSSDSSQPELPVPTPNNPPEESSAAGPSNQADSQTPPMVDQESAMPTPVDAPSESGGQGLPTVNESAGKQKIQIGSRRGDPAERPISSKPQTVGGAATKKIAIPRDDGPIVPPSVRDPLTPDLEMELAAAFDDASMDELMGGGPAAPESGFEPGTKLKAQIIRLRADDVFCSLGGPSEGVASLRQFSQPPEIGEEFEVVVRGFNAEDGLYEVALPGASIEVDDWEDLDEGSVVEARITGSNTGGLECKVNQLRGFIPASQIAMFRVEDYAEYIDQKLVCIVTEVNPQRRNLVLSRRAVLEREQEEKRKNLLESLEVGATVEGVVRSLRDFGAFVDLGGVDGLIHISQLSWDRVEHPKEILEMGQTVRVKVEKIDPQTGKIGLSYRELLEHPWTNIDEKFSVDSEVTGVVTRTAQFGAFVKIAAGIEGLVHISELSHARVANVGSIVSEGQEVNVKVLSIDADNQRIALSMKAVLPVPEPEAKPGETAADEPPPELAVPKRQGPLKGGTGTNTGGEQFGLKW